ncbi:MAG TPA: hypothetical protein PKA74_13625, partial [Bauldia sp.]|nr:hypothetical protein [Bauldia sp.]
SFATFLIGLGLVFTAGFAFTDLWIILGLCGFASTFLTGVLVLEPTGKRIGAMVARDGVTEAAIAEGRRLLAISRIDYVVLFLVVAVMVLKPTAADVAVLAVMGAILVASVGLTLASLRGRPAVAAASA